MNDSRPKTSNQRAEPAVPCLRCGRKTSDSFVRRVRISFEHWRCPTKQRSRVGRSWFAYRRLISNQRWRI